MEYYWLILNRTFLVILTNEFLIGIKGNGAIAVEGSPDLNTGINYTEPFVRDMVVKGDLTNPYKYLKEKYFTKIKEVDLLSDKFLDYNKANFRISINEIKRIYHDPKKKWGMGNYPHDGKVYIETFAGKKMELIILGHQSGQEIVNWITNLKTDIHLTPEK